MPRFGRGALVWALVWAGCCGTATAQTINGHEHTTTDCQAAGTGLGGSSLVVENDQSVQTSVESISTTGVEGYTTYQITLHLASTGNHLLIVQTLLSQGLDTASRNVYGNAPLQLTTDPACQKLLRQAAVNAVQGRNYLCSCSGDFFSAADSVAANVTDRVSRPTVRPARYSHACWAAIKASEEALEAAIKAVDTEALEAAITQAEAAGAAVALLDNGIQALSRLRAHQP